MLIELVKDSVLRCFCHTCSVNAAAIAGVGPLKKPLSKQPGRRRKKKLYAATEIRCEEKSRGGMAYEVILADPVAEKPDAVPDQGAPLGQAPRSPRQSVTAEDINMKLQQAEERRKSLEASRMACVGERLAKMEEATRKREKANEEFISASTIALEDKLELSASNREAYLAGLKSKVSEHLSNVESVRRQLESQSEELRSTIESKLKSAEENRGENLRKLIDKLKEHDEHAQKVRLGHEEAVMKLREKIQSKLLMAEAKRMSEQFKKLEILKEHDRRVEMVRANKEQKNNNDSENKNVASSG